MEQLLNQVLRLMQVHLVFLQLAVQRLIFITQLLNYPESLVVVDMVIL